MSSENVIQCNFGQDDQLDIMGALAFIQLHRRLSPLPVLDPQPKESSMERKMLHILNWISTFFVRESRCDAVASAFSIDGGKIKLYLAMNRGLPEQQDIENGDKFISALRHASLTPDPNAANGVLFNAAISVTYKRLARKLDMITRLPLRSDKPTETQHLTETFETLITKWATARGKEVEEEGITWLKRHFNTFVKLTGRWKDSIKDTTDGNPDMAKGLCSCAVLLVESDFFSKVVPLGSGATDPKIFDNKEYEWLRKLRWRLWRIARYRLDAGSVATTGIQWIKRILGDDAFREGSDSFSIEWVGRDPDILPERHGAKYIFPERPQDRFKTLVEQYGFEKSTNAEELPNLERLWPKPTSRYPHTTPLFHCELQLISYLDRHHIIPQLNLVGGSKLMCWACNVYVEALNERRGPKDDSIQSIDMRPYVLSGTSGKAHCAWLIPPGDLRDIVIKKTNIALEFAISKLAEKSGHRRIHSGGSDSSTGSRGEDSSGEEQNVFEEELGPYMSD